MCCRSVLVRGVRAFVCLTWDSCLVVDAACVQSLVDMCVASTLQNTSAHRVAAAHRTHLLDQFRATKAASENVASAWVDMEWLAYQLPPEVMDTVPGSTTEAAQAAWARVVLNGIRGGIALQGELTVSVCEWLAACLWVCVR